MTNFIQKELQQYIPLEDNEVEEFMFLLQNKGFFQPDNSWDILIKMFEASYTKGRTDLLKELSEAMKEDEED